MNLAYQSVISTNLTANYNRLISRKPIQSVNFSILTVFSSDTKFNFLNKLTDKNG